MFNFILADKIRNVTSLSQLAHQTAGLPRYQDIVRKKPDWITRIAVSPIDACRHSLKRIFLTVSHCWESKAAPDPQGEQLKSVVSYLAMHPTIEYVWFDYWCLPQGQLTTKENAELDATVPHVRACPVFV